MERERRSNLLPLRGKCREAAIGVRFPLRGKRPKADRRKERAMTQVEKLVEQIRDILEGKMVLELACGTAVFSLAAAKYAKSVVCLDLDSSRLDKRVPDMQNLDYVLADAARTGLETGRFDMVILYNAFYHIKDQWPDILAEGKRLLKPSGLFFVISSWNLDKTLMEEKLSGIVQRGIFYVCLVS